MGELRQVTKAIFRHRIRAPRISGGPSQFCLGEYKPRDTTLTKLTDDTKKSTSVKGEFTRGYILDASNLFNIYFFESAIQFLK